MRCVSFGFRYLAARRALPVVVAALVTGCSLQSVTSHGAVVVGGSRDSLQPQVVQDKEYNSFSVPVTVSTN
jgi:hypothetical protein